jgi:hypothetical protein
VKRFAWLAGGLVVLCSLLAMGAARMAGRQGSRPATLISVVTAWLGAWVLWGFVGGLANHYGIATKPVRVASTGSPSSSPVSSCGSRWCCTRTEC